MPWHAMLLTARCAWGLLVGPFSAGIESTRIESNQIESNRIESNRIGTGMRAPLVRSAASSGTVGCAVHTVAEPRATALVRV